MASSTVDISWGMLAYLMPKLEGILTALNADVAAKVTGTPAPVFNVVLGVPASVESPTLALDYNADLSPRRAAMNEKVVAMSFKVLCLLPLVGGNSPSNFAVAKARARDFVTSLFDQDLVSLTPKIDGGSLGIVYAMMGERGPITDLYGMEMEDKVTRVRGWQMMYTVWFSLTTR